MCLGLLVSSGGKSRGSRRGAARLSRLRARRATPGRPPGPPPPPPPPPGGPPPCPPPFRPNLRPRARHIFLVPVHTYIRAQSLRQHRAILAGRHGEDSRPHVLGQLHSHVSDAATGAKDHHR